MNGLILERNVAAGRLPESERPFTETGALELQPVFLMELSDIVLPDPLVSFRDRIAACDCKQVCHVLKEHWFPLTLPAGPRPLRLAYFGPGMNLRLLKSWAENNGFDFGGIEDIFAIGCHPSYRWLQLQFRIIAPRKSAYIHGEWKVPALGGHRKDRHLETAWYGAPEWPANFSFLVIPKLLIDL